MSGPEVLIPITIFAGGFAMVFGITYLRTRQNMAMIDKGMNPKIHTQRPAPYQNLKWGLLLIGAGIGLALAYIVCSHLLHEDENPALYFAFIGIGGGLGLVGSYRAERAWLDKQEAKDAAAGA
jgi:drug/metabolite transporter (DMT)-like permease